MALNRNILQFYNAMGSYRNILSSRLIFANHQSLATMAKKSVEELAGMPPKPKKPLAPFIKWSHSVRPSIKQSHPNAQQAELYQLIKDQWEKMDTASKNQMLEEWKTSLEQYRDSKSKYEGSMTPEQKVELKRLQMELKLTRDQKKLRRDSEVLKKPKKPLTPFRYFLLAESENRGDLKINEWHNLLLKKWEALSPEKKAKFEKLSEIDSKNYELKMHKWAETEEDNTSKTKSREKPDKGHIKLGELIFHYNHPKSIPWADRYY